MTRKAPFYGRVLITIEKIHTVTGLHIGGSGSDFNIGGRDKLVIRDPLTNQPYIPGSSLRGKMRSLLEKARQLDQNHRINKGFIHVCKEVDDFKKCPVCSVFGIPAPRKVEEWTGVVTLSRLVVRDIYLADGEADRLMAAHTDGLYTEFKTEVAIDRVTSAANPRTIERVPAGVAFGPAELVFSIYDPDDIGRLEVVLQALQLVEDDYLGGNGSRGYGKVAFKDIVIYARSAGNYSEKKHIAEYADLSEWAAAFEKGFLDKVERVIFPENGG